MGTAHRREYLTKGTQSICCINVLIFSLTAAFRLADTSVCDLALISPPFLLESENGTFQEKVSKGRHRSPKLGPTTNI